MRPSFRALALIVLARLAAAAAAQDAVPAPEPEPQPAAPAPSTAPTAPAPAVPVPAPSFSPAPAPVPSRVDALELYRQGRNLESAGRTAEALGRYREAVAVCDRELAADPARMDAYAVKYWSLFRLDRFREVVDTANAGLKVRYDPRLSEVMGEAYFHLGNNDLALKNLQRYIENMGEFGDRVSTAYFYMGEIYQRLRKYDHADIAYALALHRDPSMSRWWFRYGQAVEALKDYRRAADLYARALKLSPEMKEASDALARVRSRI